MTHTSEKDRINILFIGSVVAQNTNDSFWHTSLNDHEIYIEYNYN